MDAEMVKIAAIIARPTTLNNKLVAAIDCAIANTDPLATFPITECHAAAHDLPKTPPVVKPSTLNIPSNMKANAMLAGQLIKTILRIVWKSILFFMFRLK